MSNDAILMLHTPNYKVDLLHGTDGIHVVDWEPAIADYKDGGIWQSSPVADGESLVDAYYENTTQVVTISVIASDSDSIARKLRKLRMALKEVDASWIDDFNVYPCYLEARAACETNTRYAILKTGRLPRERRPFGSGFMQPRGNRLQHELELTLVHEHFREFPPLNTDGEASKAPLATRGSGYYLGKNYGNTSPAFGEQDTAPALTNYIKNGSFTDWDTAEKASHWLGENIGGATGVAIPYRETAHVIDGSSALGIWYGNFTNIWLAHWQQVSDVTEGVTYRISVWVKVLADPILLELRASDGGGWSNTVLDASWFSAPTTDWVRLQVIKTAPASGIRVALVSSNDDPAFDGYVVWDRVVVEENVTPPSSTSVPVYVSSRYSKANITHIYNYSGSVWTDVSSSGQIQMPTATNNAAIYFGIEAAGNDYSPFNNLATEMEGSVIARPVNSRWQYAQENQFTNLAVLTDNTERLSKSGAHTVVWQPPDDWLPRNLQTVTGDGTAPNVTAYWIRIRNTSTGPNLGTIELTRDVYAVQWPYIDINASALGGGEIPVLLQASLRNKSGGGPQVELEDYQPIAGTNDIVSIDREATSLALGPGTRIVGGQIGSSDEGRYDLGVRFTGYSVPPLASIIDARILINKTSGSPPALLLVRAESSATSAAFSTYANYISRVRLPVEDVHWQLPPQSGVVTSPNIADTINALHAIPGWSTSSAMTLFLEASKPVGTSSVTADVGIHGAGPFLQVTYLINGMYTTRIFSSARSLHRGSNYNAFINTSDRQVPDGVTVATGQGARFVDLPESATGRGLRILLPTGSSTLPIDAAKISIVNPLSAEYYGLFRVFVRAELIGVSPSRLRLAYSAFGSPPRYSRFVAMRVRQPLLNRALQTLDFGAVSIPVTSGYSGDIEITVQFSKTVNSGSEGVIIYDIILMPADEWVGDVGRTDGVYDSVLRNNQCVIVDSIDHFKRGAVEARKECVTELARAMWPSAATGKFSVKPALDARLWFLPFSSDGLGEGRDLGSTGPQNVLSVNLMRSAQYLSLRGDE